MMRKLLSLACVLVLCGAAWGQSTQYGDPNFDRATDWRSGQPNILTLSSGDAFYEFGGSPWSCLSTWTGGLPKCTWRLL